MKRFILFLLIPLALNAQNFKHGSATVSGVSDYSEGTIETDTLRTRYIRLLDGLNSDSIASYIYFDGDTSRWTGDPIKIGNNSIIVKDDTVKISNAMMTVTGQVQVDTLVPYQNSTIYVRHFTVDTIEIVKYFHQQEIGVVDSMTYFARDGDTLKIDPSISGNVIEYEDENVTVWNVDSTGTQTITKPGIGTLPTTAATINAIGLVLQNTTAAANGAQQDSPPLRFRGYGWGTTAGTSKSLDWVIYSKISQGVSPTTTLSFLYSANGGAYTQLATLTETGIFSTNYLTAAVNVRVLVTSLTTTPTDGLVAAQDALCTAAMPYRISPRLRFGACVWDSSGTPASKAQNFTNEVIPTSGGAVLPAPSASTARLRWSFDHNGGGYSEIMSLRGDGNLGLGTTNPTAKLSVDGNKTTSNLAQFVNDNDGAVGDSSVAISKLGVITAQGLTLSGASNTITVIDTVKTGSGVNRWLKLTIDGVVLWTKCVADTATW